MEEKHIYKRWYDNYQDLGVYLEKLKHFRAGRQGEIFGKIMAVLEQQCPEYRNFDVSQIKESRRWYDKQTYARITINSLKASSARGKEAVRQLLKKELSPEISFSQSDFPYIQQANSF